MRNYKMGCMFSSNIETKNMFNRANQKTSELDNNNDLAVELLEAGVDIGPKDGYEKSTLIIAMCRTQRDLIKDLIKHKADAQQQCHSELDNVKLVETQDQAYAKLAKIAKIVNKHLIAQPSCISLNLSTCT